MIKHKSIFLITILLLPSIYSEAQIIYGIWTNTGIEKKINNLRINSNIEFRTQNNKAIYDRVSFSTDISYKFFKNFSIGAGYEFIGFNDDKYNDFQPRQRYFALIAGQYKINRFSFSLKEKIQRTIKDEHDRIKINGKIDNYKINPEWTWRNKLSIDYNIPKFRIDPTFSIETFYQLNNPEENKLDKIRYTLSFEYKINFHNRIELSGIYDNKTEENSFKKIILGLGYKYVF